MCTLAIGSKARRRWRTKAATCRRSGCAWTGGGGWRGGKRGVLALSFGATDVTERGLIRTGFRARSARTFIASFFEDCVKRRATVIRKPRQSGQVGPAVRYTHLWSGLYGRCATQRGNLHDHDFESAALKSTSCRYFGGSTHDAGNFGVSYGFALTNEIVGWLKTKAAPVFPSL